MEIKNKFKTWFTRTPNAATDPGSDESVNAAVVDLELRYRPSAQRRQAVIREYERCLKNRTSVSEIHDESELPFSKRETLDAISLQLLVEEDHRKVEALKASAIFLADYQKGVGKKPLTLLGISDLDMLNVNFQDLGNLNDPVSTIENNPDKEKYRTLRKLADHELAYILTRLTEVMALKEKPASLAHPPQDEIQRTVLLH